MAHGGARAGAGRKKGQATQMNEDARAKALEGGTTPLEYMLAVLREETNSKEVRMDAAKAAAPYVHARLAAVEHSGGVTLHHEDALDALDGEGETDSEATEG